MTLDKGLQPASASRNMDSLIERANEQLYKEACEKFGKQSVDTANLNKKDLAEMTAIAVLGPGMCKSMGHEKTKLTGAALVSLVTPALIGGMEEGKEQLTKKPMESVHNASGNILMGAGFGALAVWNPVLAAAVGVVGGGFFINDQLNSPRNKERNKLMFDVASRMNNMDNRQFVSESIKLKSYLGPDAYNAAFTTATMSIGFRPGQQVANAIKGNIGHLPIAANKVGRILATQIEGIFGTQTKPIFAPAIEGRLTNHDIRSNVLTMSQYENEFTPQKPKPVDVHKSNSSEQKPTEKDLNETLKSAETDPLLIIEKNHSQLYKVLVPSEPIYVHKPDCTKQIQAEKDLSKALNSAVKDIKLSEKNQPELDLYMIKSLLLEAQFGLPSAQKFRLLKGALGYLHQYKDTSVETQRAFKSIESALALREDLLQVWKPKIKQTSRGDKGDWFIWYDK